MQQSFSRILDLTNDFCEKLQQRIAGIEQNLPTIETMLQQSLKSHLTASDVAKIMAILRSNGILKDEFEFDASKIGFTQE